MLHISLPQKHGLSAMSKLGHDVIAFNADLGLYSKSEDDARLEELRKTAINKFLDEMNDDDESDWLEDAS